MPTPTLETLKKREATLKGKLAGKPVSPERSRALRKRLRRAQRRRRKLVARTARAKAASTEA
jgi:hypothetical protein